MEHGSANAGTSTIVPNGSLSTQNFIHFRTTTFKVSNYRWTDTSKRSIDENQMNRPTHKT